MGHNKCIALGVKIEISQIYGKTYRTPPWLVGPLSTATMSEAIGLLDGLIKPAVSSSSICRCISGFNTSGIWYSLSLLGLNSGETTILCSTYGQNPGFSAKRAENSFNNCRKSFLSISFKCCSLFASILECWKKRQPNSARWIQFLRGWLNNSAAYLHLSLRTCAMRRLTSGHFQSTKKELLQANC